MRLVRISHWWLLPASFQRWWHYPAFSFDAKRKCCTSLSIHYTPINTLFQHPLITHSSPTHPNLPLIKILRDATHHHSPNATPYKQHHTAVELREWPSRMAVMQRLRMEPRPAIQSTYNKWCFGRTSMSRHQARPISPSSFIARLRLNYVAFWYSLSFSRQFDR